MGEVRDNFFISLAYLERRSYIDTYTAWSGNSRGISKVFLYVYIVRCYRPLRGSNSLDHHGSIMATEIWLFFFFTFLFINRLHEGDQIIDYV